MIHFSMRLGTGTGAGSAAGEQVSIRLGLGGGAGCIEPMRGGGASLWNVLGIPCPVFVHKKIF